MSPAVCGDPGIFQDVSSDVWGSGNASKCLQWCVRIRECFRMSPVVCGNTGMFKGCLHGCVGIRECLKMSPVVCVDPLMFQDVSSGVCGSSNVSGCLQWCVWIL